MIITVDVHGMTCSVCTSTVEKELLKLPDVVQVTVALSTLRATVEVTENSKTGLRAIVQCISDLGFTPVIPDASTENQRLAILHAADISQWKHAFKFSLCFALPTFFLSMIPHKGSVYRHFYYAQQGPSHGILEFELFRGLSICHFIQLILTIPLLFGPWVGGKFFRGAYSALKHKSASMDVLVALGTSSAFFSSIFAIFNVALFSKNSHQIPIVFFDTCCMLLLFISFGKYLENIARSKTSFALSNLLSLNPDVAVLVEVQETKSNPSFSDGKNYRIISESEMPSEILEKGDYIKIVTGSKVSADGIVVQGSASIDESMITGESIPSLKKIGDSVIAGSVNMNGSIIIRATNVGAETALARIVALVENAQSSKAPIQHHADRIASYFVPTVILLAFFTLVVWLLITLSVGSFPFLLQDRQTTMDSVLLCVHMAISVVVIACPCTLGLSVPTAVMVGTGIGAQLGILIKGGESLENAHKLDHLVFDKTGTLTFGHMTVIKETIPQKWWPLIGAAELQSQHPLAKALSDYAKSNSSSYSVTEVQEMHGLGLCCFVSDESLTFFISIGNAKLMESVGCIVDDETINQIDNEQKKGKTVVFVSVDSKFVGFAAMADTLKPGADLVVQSLVSMGIEVSMVTGDNYDTASVFAKECSIKNIYAGASPANKALIVAALQSGNPEMLTLAASKCQYTQNHKFYKKQKSFLRKMFSRKRESSIESLELLNGSTFDLSMPLKQNEKVQIIDKKIVAMVGDGINDSPGLAAADIGIALGTGTDIAMETANIIIMSSSILDLLVAIDLSKKIFSRIRMNFFWSGLYNVVSIPIAMGVLVPWGIVLHPMNAGGAMALSSVSVVLSSLLLKRYKKPSWIAKLQ